MNKMRAIGYVRRSLEDKDKENLSIQNQDELIMQYAKDEGYEFISDPESVIDKDGYKAHSFNEGYTSSAKCNRLVLKRMIKFAQEHDIDWIIVKETSRLGRIVLQIEPLCQRLKFKNIKVWSIVEEYDIVDNDARRLLITNINQEHFDNSSKAQRAMMKNKENNKLLFSRPPFGYKVKRGINAYGKAYSIGWEIEEGKANIIRDMFDYFNEDGSYMKFAEKLGINKSMIKKWLKNKIYCGYFTYNKFVYEPLKIVVDKNGNEIETKKLHEKTTHQYRVDPSVLTPIITLETWEKAQRRFDELRKRYAKKCES